MQKTLFSTTPRFSTLTFLEHIITALYVGLLADK